MASAWRVFRFGTGASVQEVLRVSARIIHHTSTGRGPGAASGLGLAQFAGSGPVSATRLEEIHMSGFALSDSDVHRAGGIPQLITPRRNAESIRGTRIASEPLLTDLA